MITSVRLLNKLMRGKHLFSVIQQNHVISKSFYSEYCDKNVCFLLMLWFVKKPSTVFLQLALSHTVCPQFTCSYWDWSKIAEYHCDVAQSWSCSYNNLISTKCNKFVINISYIIMTSMHDFELLFQAEIRFNIIVSWLGFSIITTHTLTIILTGHVFTLHRT